jgi:hypothetical protein
MNYRLIVLTHGDHQEELLRTISSFSEMVEPSPVEKHLVVDGPFASHHLDFSDWKLHPSKKQEGFCAAVYRGWEEVAAPPGVEWVFWLEHDFLFRRPVDLRDIAKVMNRNDQLAQMSLMRQPVNARELAAGSILAADPDSFGRHQDPEGRWLSQKIYWTTNPSLFPRELATQRTWPLEKQCEGVFTHELLADDPGIEFGIWGSGESWVEHIGVRTGKGY